VASTSLRQGDETRSARKALVTGGSSGIGAATARAFAARGFAVVIAGRDLDALKTVAADTGGPYVTGDLREPGVPERIVHEAVAALGGLDVVVSNAGAGWSGPFASMTDAEIDSLLDVNLRAGAHLTRAALRYLPAGTGHLVFTGSIAGRVVYEGGGGYTAAKHAETAMIETLRLELNGRPVRVTEIAPGMVRTEEFSLNRLHGDAKAAARVYAGVDEPLVAEDIADCIAFAVTRPRHVNVDLLVVKPLAQAAPHKVARR
jgi:NADP-dependent 3-hydroxy acid dehydrogenase YdfG